MIRKRRIIFRKLEVCILAYLLVMFFQKSKRVNLMQKSYWLILQLIIEVVIKATIDANS